MTKNSVSHSVSQEPNQFLLHMCKMMISELYQGFESNFQFFYMPYIGRQNNQEMKQPDN